MFLAAGRVRLGTLRAQLRRAGGGDVPREVATTRSTGLVFRYRWLDLGCGLVLLELP